MLIPRIIIYRANIFVKNRVCVGEDCLRTLYPL